MKKTLLLFSLLFISSITLAAPKHIAKVYFIKGKAYSQNYKNSRKKKLIKGAKLTTGTIIQTAKKSKVYIELNDGIKIYIPPKTKFFIFDKKNLEIYKKTEKSLDKFFTLVGTKAVSSDDLKNNNISDKIENLFLEKKYFEIIQTIESINISDTSPAIRYKVALSHLKVGQNTKAIKYFQQFIDEDIFEYKNLSIFGQFIANIRMNNIVEIKRILKHTGRNFQFYKNMKEFMK